MLVLVPPVWWTCRASEGMVGFPRKQRDTYTHMHIDVRTLPYQSTHRPYAVQQLEGIFVQTHLCYTQTWHTHPHVSAHIHTRTHRFTHLHAVMLQSTSKVPGIEIPCLSYSASDDRRGLEAVRQAVVLNTKSACWQVFKHLTTFTASHV